MIDLTKDNSEHVLFVIGNDKYTLYHFKDTDGVDYFEIGRSGYKHNIMFEEIRGIKGETTGMVQDELDYYIVFYKLALKKAESIIIFT